MAVFNMFLTFFGAVFFVMTHIYGQTKYILQKNCPHISFPCCREAPNILHPLLKRPHRLLNWQIQVTRVSWVGQSTRGTPPFKKLIMNFELNSLKGNDYFLRRSQSTILSCIAWLSIDSMVQKTYDFTDLSGDWRWSITILSLSTTSSTILPETSISWITVLSFILILS